jgi:broad specificity phosphatase PhoE
MALTLIRHAHTIWNGPPKRFQGRTDVPISKKGIADCIELSTRIHPPDHIVCSPALRCRQTLQNLFPINATPIYYDERLLEINNGFFSGLLESEAAARYPAMFKLWKESPDRVRIGDGETLQEMQTRVFSAIEDITYHHHNEEVLVLTHGGPIRILLLALQKKPLKQFHSLVIPNLERIRLDALQLSSLLSYEKFREEYAIVSKHEKN